MALAESSRRRRRCLVHRLLIPARHRAGIAFTTPPSGTAGRDRTGGGSFGALVEHGRRTPERGDIAAEYVAGILKWIRRAIADGIERAELVASTEDVDAHIDRSVTELSGPLLVEHILLGRTVTEEDGRAAVETFLLRRGAP